MVSLDLGLFSPWHKCPQSELLDINMHIKFWINFKDEERHWKPIKIRKIDEEITYYSAASKSRKIFEMCKIPNSLFASAAAHCISRSSRFSYVTSLVSSSCLSFFAPATIDWFFVIAWLAWVTWFVGLKMWLLVRFLKDRSKFNYFS